jgi:hypothetical protein
MQQFDRHFVRSLVIAFNEVLPSGSLKEIRDQFQVSEHTPAKVLRGEFNNEDIVLHALKQILVQQDLVERFLAQFPEETILNIKRKALA